MDWQESIVLMEQEISVVAEGINSASGRAVEVEVFGKNWAPKPWDSYGGDGICIKNRDYKPWISGCTWSTTP